MQHKRVKWGMIRLACFLLVSTAALLGLSLAAAPQQTSHAQGNAPKAGTEVVDVPAASETPNPTAPLASTLYVDAGATHALGPSHALDTPRAPAENASLTLSTTVLGKTTTYIGATEAGGFWIEDLQDLGINTYRLWTKMDELEWWDDDDAWATPAYACTHIGTPTTATIKLDQASGFTNTIPWGWWDERLDEVQAWRYGVQTRHTIITALVESGITPVVVLRAHDDAGRPNYCDGDWAPRPPVTETFRSEWWEHCFALAYWLNVRHDYGVTHFEVLNEPEWNCQGWCNPSSCGWGYTFCGTQPDYVQLVLDAHDAISYANSLAGLPAYIHAPVVANYNSPYVAYTLDNADAAVQVVDYHYYEDNLPGSIAFVSSTIQAHNPDGTLEPMWVSEWGALWRSYDTLAEAMRTADQLFTMSEAGVEGATVFNMYDWDTSPGGNYGLVDLQDDGAGGATRVYSEGYYAYRLLSRGLVGGKERLAHAAGGFMGGTRTRVTRDAAYVYVIVLRHNLAVTASIDVDLTALGTGSGTVEVWEYSAAHKDSLVTTPTMTGGHVSFSAPANGIALVQVDRQVLAAQADLAIVKTTSPSTAAPGQAITYSLRYTNFGPAVATGLLITDLVPISLTNIMTAYSGALVTPTGSLSYAWQVEDLAPGAGGAISLSGILSPALAGPYTLTNTATITSASIDTDTANNHSTVQVLVSNILYVDADASGASSGLSWADAFTEVRSALAVAVSGDEIWVAQGVYKTDYDPGSGTHTGSRLSTFQLADDIALYGGFAGIETLRTQRDCTAHPTLLSGDISVQGSRSDNAYHVVTASGVTGTAVLDGFILTGGNANASAFPNDRGGGLFNHLGSPTLANLTFSDNTAQYGGGLANQRGDAALANVVFNQNTAAYGGGLYNFYGSSTLAGVTFTGNIASANGGGIVWLLQQLGADKHGF